MLRHYFFIIFYVCSNNILIVQNDFNKTISAIQSELAAFKSAKGTPKAQTHIDNLKKLNAIKNKLENELEDSVSSLYRDAELKIED